MHTITKHLKDKYELILKRNLSDESIRVFLKEELQDYLLSAIYRSELGKDIVFIGGTALRKLYGLNRLSEDLDFVIGENVDFAQLVPIIEDYLKSLDFNDFSIKIHQGDRLNRIIVKFEVLGKIGYSGYSNEKLHVKIEATKSKLFPTVTQYKNFANSPVVITTYPIEILMSGKILACLTRVFNRNGLKETVKGRNFYDLVWYMEKKIIPDEKFLTHFESNITLGNVYKLLDKKVSTINTSHLLLDLQPFFEDAKAIEMWCNNFHQIYDSVRSNY